MTYLNTAGSATLPASSYLSSPDCGLQGTPHIARHLMFRRTEHSIGTPLDQGEGLTQLQHSTVPIALSQAAGSGLPHSQLWLLVIPTLIALAASHKLIGVATIASACRQTGKTLHWWPDDPDRSVARSMFGPRAAI